MKRARGTLGSRESTRSVFTELVDEACDELGQRPSPQATGYVVDLLDARVRARTPATPEEAPPDTLALAMVEALQDAGASRWVRLRALGDRALFDAGFFAERVERTVVGVEYYTDMGRAAYARLSAGLATGRAPRATDDLVRGPAAPDVFHELARHFRDFVTLLAEVGDRARGERAVDLLSLYDRYRARGAERDRVRLLRRGMVPPAGGGPEPVQ